MELKAYPEYKDSKTSWADNIPFKWEEYTIKRIGILNSGNGFPESLQGHSKGDIPFLNVSDINDPKTIFVNVSKNYVTFKIAAEHKWNIIPEYSIIFPKIGEAINKNHRKINEKLVIIDNNLSSFSPNSEFFYKYVYYIFKEINMKDFLNVSAVPSVNMGLFTSFKVPLTLNMDEQKQISSFLDKKTSEIDLTIEKYTRLIELLKEKRTALINHVVTKGLDPTVKMKDSGVEWIGEIPEDWEILPLHSLFKERKVKNIRNKEENVLSLSYGRIVRRNVETNFGLLPESFATYQIIEPDCIVLRLTDLQNDKKSLRTGLVKEKGIITSAYLALEKKKNFDVNYVHYLLHAYDLVKVFYNLGGGVRQSMRFEDMKKMPILYPPIDEQTEISHYIDDKTKKLENFILQISKHTELLEEYKKSLIHHVVTGKVDVQEVAV